MAIKILAIVFALPGFVCWVWPGAIGGLLFHALPVSAREADINWQARSAGTDA
jgi:hypothetical protein